MRIEIPYGNAPIQLELPDDTTVYRTSYGRPKGNARDLVLKAIRNPVGSPPLLETLRTSGARSVVVVVSDITRPIPYADFLGALLEEIEHAGVLRNNILILIATGMHKPSTAAERDKMFGPGICEHYRIMDHHAEMAGDLVRIDATSHAGRPIELNRHFVQADFRIVTGLVEPHFMAGFSGGRKAVCPGLCSLETVEAFHSFSFLDNPAARNGNLQGNPLHQEALSIARQARVGFCVNLLVDNEHRLLEAIAGDLEASHDAACQVASQHACPPVRQEKDVVITSCGGHPLDATFYQCVKGMVSCLPAVKRGGTVVAAGSCSDGIGGEEYRGIMHEYAGRWREFLAHAQRSSKTAKDHWQFQMQTRTLRHVGDTNLVFLTSGLSALELGRLSLVGTHASESRIQEKLQEMVDGFADTGRSLAVVPEGPYCAPLTPDSRVPPAISQF